MTARFQLVRALLDLLFQAGIHSLAESRMIRESWKGDVSATGRSRSWRPLRPRDTAADRSFRSALSSSCGRRRSLKASRVDEAPDMPRAAPGPASEYGKASW